MGAPARPPLQPGRSPAGGGAYGRSNSENSWNSFWVRMRRLLRQRSWECLIRPRAHLFRELPPEIRHRPQLPAYVRMKHWYEVKKPTTLALLANPGGGAHRSKCTPVSFYTDWPVEYTLRWAAALHQMAGVFVCSTTNKTAQVHHPGRYLRGRPPSPGLFSLPGLRPDISDNYHRPYEVLVIMQCRYLHGHYCFQRRQEKYVQHQPIVTVPALRHTCFHRRSVQSFGSSHLVNIC